MKFKPFSITRTPLTTYFLWSPDYKVTAQLTKISEDYFLVQASKSYSLLKQGEDGRETWSRNISNLNKYLKRKFSNVELKSSYINTVDENNLREKIEAREKIDKARSNNKQITDIENSIIELEKELGSGFEDLESVIGEKLEIARSKKDHLEKENHQLARQLEHLKKRISAWKSKGVMHAYIFSFSTSAQVVRKNNLSSAIQEHTSTVYKDHQHRVKQTLEGSNFKLKIKELEYPELFLNQGYATALHPEEIEKAKERTDLQQPLQELQHQVLKSFENFATFDLETENGVFEPEDSTPARAWQSLLTELKKEQFTETSEDVPNNGPFIGTIPETDQVVGFDPSEVPHLYIVGESGSGKSHFKRVLIENVASLGYHVLTINPGDTQNIGLGLPNENYDDSSSIPFNQYWIGDSRFLDKPDSFNDFFTGLNAVTLRGLPSDEKQEFINKVFTTLSSIDSTDQPLFVFLDEAHNFNQGAAANSIQKIARESRKFGVNLVIASQSPTDYSYNQRHVRENTTKIFLNGEYFDYANKFLEDGNQISRLDTGHCIIPETRDLPRMTIDIRDVLTRFWEHTPSEDEIEEVAQRFEKQIPDFDDRESSYRKDTGKAEMSYSEDPVETDLTEDEDKVVEAIQNYIRENDQTPSKNKTVEASPFGTGKTSRILDQLTEKDAVRKETETRYGNEAQVYSVTYDN